MPDEFEPGECDRCGHERPYTATVDGECVCILCLEGISGGYEADV